MSAKSAKTAKSGQKRKKATATTRSKAIKKGAQGTDMPENVRNHVKTEPARKSVPQARKEQKVESKAAAARENAHIAAATDVGTLSDKHLRFVDAYLVDMNATKAAIAAGYSQKTAGQIGFTLLKKVEIQQVISAKQNELAHKRGITLERTITEAARVAFSDVRRIVDEHGNLKAIHELDDDVAAAIASIKLIVTGSGDDVEMTKEIRFWPKMSAIDTLVKQLGLNKGRANALLELSDEELDAKIAMHMLTLKKG